MNGRKGYVWLVTTDDATYLVAAPSRAAIILDKYFSKLLDIPVVVDGYTVYNAFPVKQRCWVHILRKAEKFAIRKGGNYLSCHLRLLAMYKRIKAGMPYERIDTVNNTMKRLPNFILEIVVW